MIDKMERQARAVVNAATFEAVERQDGELVSIYFVLVLSEQPDSLGARVLASLKIVREDFEDAIPKPTLRMVSGRPLPSVGLAKSLTRSLQHSMRAGRMYVTPDDLFVGTVEDPDVVQVLWRLGAELTPAEIIERVYRLILQQSSSSHTAPT